MLGKPTSVRFILANRLKVITNHLKRTILADACEQKGVTLLEILFAIALLGIVGVVFLSALPSSSITMAKMRGKVDTDSLARSQMEYTKNCSYVEYIYGSPDIPPDYPTLDELAPSDNYAISIPTGYSVNVTANALNNPDDGIQQITVTVSKDGGDLLSIEGYKLDR